MGVSRSVGLSDVRLAARSHWRSARSALTTVASLGVGLALAAATPRAQTSTSPEVFVASTPCDAPIASLLVLPSGPCDFVRWRLSLDSGEPRRFSLTVSFGVAQPNTLGFVGGGRRVSLHGTVQVRRKPRPGQSVEIYRLDRAASVAPIALLRINENLLQLLHADDTPMVGNGGWSYTLNRETPIPSAPNPAFWFGSPGRADGTATVFEGRTPCHEIAGRLGLADQAGCFKIKWKLTLIRDANTGQPTTYMLDRTGHRDAPIVGRWTVSDNRSGDSGPIVYQLDPDSPTTSLSFLAVNDSLLFFLDSRGQLLTGNADFSYTLNERAD